MLTILILQEAYSKPTRFKPAAPNPRSEQSVWIIPAGLDGDDDIDDLLARAGIRVLERAPETEAEACANDILQKFKTANLPAKKEFLCND